MLKQSFRGSEELKNAEEVRIRFRRAEAGAERGPCWRQVYALERARMMKQAGPGRESVSTEAQILASLSSLSSARLGSSMNLV